jgi:hypothetical protein
MTDPALDRAAARVPPAPPPPAAPSNPEPPYGFMALGLKSGDVVPFFGAAASAIYRPSDEAWDLGKPFMPFGGELAQALAKAASFPTEAALHAVTNDLVASLIKNCPGIQAAEAEAALVPVLRNHFATNLALIASWAQHVAGSRRAVDRLLRGAFAVSAQPGLLHTSLASVSATKLYVTTNYDDLLEQALADRNPHVIIDRGDKGLWVSVAGSGTFQQVAPTGDELYKLLDDPKTQEPSHPIIFKMHGSIDKTNAKNDSFLITEEDYVDFLGRTGGSYIPPYLMGLMQNKGILFLGYSLEDWNVRVILRKLLKPPKAEDVKCWAIVKGRTDREREVWNARDLNVYSVDLASFAQNLAALL